MNLRNTDGRVYAQFVPSSPTAIESMLRLAKVNSEDIVYDIGCGEGAVLYEACQLGTKTIGVDYDGRLVARAKENLRGMNARLSHGNILLESRFWFHKGYRNPHVVGNATVVTMYLGNGLNESLKPLLEKELNRGTRVVSSFFPVRGWVPAEVDRKNIVFLYVL